MSRRAAGFTLLELMVAIGIFGILATMAYGGLNSVLKTRARVEQALSRTEEYDRAYLRLRADFENAASRPVRGGDGEALPAFAFDSSVRRVEFTRGGWQNLLSLPRSTLERVSYFLDDSQPDGSRARFVDKRLVRRSWLVLDRAPQTQPLDLILLEHVDELGWRFFDDKGVAQDSWPAASNGGFGAVSAAQPAPTAIEIRLTTQDWGELKFLFRVGAEGAAKIAGLSKSVAPVPPPPGTNPALPTPQPTPGVEPPAQ